MCIIIYKPENIALETRFIYNSFKHNRHGAGFMAWDSKNDKLIVKKGFFSIEDFLKAFEPYKNSRCILHFRKRSRGAKNEENCHPFMITDDLAFVHNGTIKLDKVKIWNRHFSDTWHFCEAFLKPLLSKYRDLWMHKTFGFLIENYITERNRFAFMDNMGNVKIYNSCNGKWSDNGCWFSNESYKTYKGEDLEGIKRWCRGWDKAMKRNRHLIFA
jgi:predicted glutamine amidotransferase